MQRALVLTVVLVACGGGGGDAPSPDGGGGLPDGGGTGADAARSDGCGVASPTGRVDGMIDVGGAARTYILDVPTGYDPSQPYPLIFAWHGRGGSGSLARMYFGIGGLAGSAALIVYPDGLPVSATPGDTGWELTEAGRDVALYDAILADLAARYCVGRVYSMGHSFGGYMSNTVACYRGGTGPLATRAIAPIAGGGPFTACGGDPVSAVVIHGMQDMVVPFTQGEGSRDRWRDDAGCMTASTPITPSPCIEYGGCTAGLTVRFCAHAETAGMGHGWPSWAAGAAWELFQASP